MTDTLQQIFRQSPNLREIVRMIMLSVGRGGQGDVGQRIRDEILVIQVKTLIFSPFSCFQQFWPSLEKLLSSMSFPLLRPLPLHCFLPEIKFVILYFPLFFF